MKRYTIWSIALLIGFSIGGCVNVISSSGLQSSSMQQKQPDSIEKTQVYDDHALIEMQAHKLFNEYEMKMLNMTIQNTKIMDQPQKIYTYDVEFSKDLKLENKSWFQSLFYSLAQVSRFSPFKLIDSKNQISIEVWSDPSQQSIIEVKINGRSDYFTYLKKNELIRNYRYIAPIDVPVYKYNSTIQKLIRAKWNPSAAIQMLGKPELRFDNEEIYFDKGLKVSEETKVNRLVFNNRFTGNIVQNIHMKSSRKDITKTLGKPHFENPNFQLFGYKLVDAYIFFYGDSVLKEVSIYRREQVKNNIQFKELIAKYAAKDSYMIKQFADELKQLWPDYNYSFQENNSIALEYDTTGIHLQSVGLEWDQISPYITVYGNYIGEIDNHLSFPSNVDQLITYNNPMIGWELDKDAVFEKEQTRIKRTQRMEDRRVSETEGIVSPDGKKKIVENDKNTFENAGFFILDIGRNKADVEVLTKHFPQRMQWLSSRYISYDVVYYGIFIYDAVKNVVIPISDPQKDVGKGLQIVSIENGNIVYGSESSDAERVSKAYSFNKKGELIFKSTD